MAAVPAFYLMHMEIQYIGENCPANRAQQIKLPVVVSKSFCSSKHLLHWQQGMWVCDNYDTPPFGRGGASSSWSGQSTKVLVQSVVLFSPEAKYKEASVPLANTSEAVQQGGSQQFLLHTLISKLIQYHETSPVTFASRSCRANIIHVELITAPIKKKQKTSRQHSRFLFTAELKRSATVLVKSQNDSLLCGGALFSGPTWNFVIVTADMVRNNISLKKGGM